MQFAEGIRLALQQIWTEKLKSFFSLLGVIVGVMFLIVVVSIVEGLDRYIREDLASVAFGVNTVTLRRWSDGPTFGGSGGRARQRRPRITYEDWEAVREQITVPARWARRAIRVVRSSPTTVSRSRMFGFKPSRPRSWRFATVRRKGARLFSAGGRAWHRSRRARYGDRESALRKSRSHRPPCPHPRISVSRGRRPGGARSLFGQSLDNQAIAPARSPIQAVTNPRGIVDQVVAQAQDPADLRALQREIEGIMRTQRRLRPAQDNNFSVETAEETLSFWDNISRILFIALPGLVAISLVVGGVVIMNIMLVSVMQRTREIGVRKAIGARREDILSQILIESVTLSGVGAAVGVGVGIGLTFLVRTLSPLPAAVDARWIAVGVSLGVVVGVVSGVSPPCGLPSSPPSTP